MQKRKPWKWLIKDSSSADKQGGNTAFQAERKACAKEKKHEKWAWLMTFALSRATFPVLAKRQLEFQPQELYLKLNWLRMKPITFRSPPLPPDGLNYSPWSRKHRDSNSGSRVDWLVWCNSCVMGGDQTPPRALSRRHDYGKVRRSSADWGSSQR